MFRNRLLLTALAVAMHLACDRESADKPVQENIMVPVVEGSPTDQAGQINPGLGPDSGSDDSVDLELDFPLGLTIGQADFLRNLGAAVAVKADNLVLLNQNVAAELKQFCSNLEPAALDKTQQAWRQLMLGWQEMEIMQLGPLVEDAKTLKVNIYSWPMAANLCKIDEEAIASWTLPAYSLPSNYNRKGLLAMEYLLFDESMESRCSRSNPITGQWNQLSLAERWQARCSYLHLLSAELQQNLDLFRARWGQADQNVLSQALGQSSLEKKYLQEVFDNMFYLDIELKNRKLGEALGLESRYCRQSPEPCLDQQELSFSGLSRAAIDVNLRVFADLVFGPMQEPDQERQGGMTAVLRDQGAQDLADKSEDEFVELFQFAASDRSSLESLAAEQAKQVCEENSFTWTCQLLEKIRLISGSLKREYAAVLGLRVPDSTQGDND